MAAWYLFLIKKILLEYSPLGGCCVYPVPGQVLLCVEIHLWAAFSEARRTDEPASEPWACMHVVPIIASSTHSPLGTFWGQRRGPRNRPSPAGPLPFPFSRGRVSAPEGSRSQIGVEPGVHGPLMEKVGQSRGQRSLPGTKFKVKPADHQGGLLPYPHSSQKLPGSGLRQVVLVKKEKVESLSCPFMCYAF